MLLQTMSSSCTANLFVDVKTDVSNASDDEILFDNMEWNFLAEDCQEDVEEDAEDAAGDDDNEDRE
jgi:hypothetical protein